MNNVLLGKTVKAMYKLSGKTINQLSEETDLSVDTINNLFYARLLKPGYFGVSALVEATGYTGRDLSEFLKLAEKLPEDADITAEFAKYILSVRETGTPADSAAACSGTADGTVPKQTEKGEALPGEPDCINQIHYHYEEEMKQSFQNQKESFLRENRMLRRVNMILSGSLALAMIVLAIALLK